MSPASESLRLKRRPGRRTIVYSCLAFVLLASYPAASGRKPGRFAARQHVTAKTMKTLRHSYIDRGGRTVIDAGRYQRVGGFSEGLAGVYLAGRGWGFIDKTGKVVIEPQFEAGGSFSEGLAVVVVKGKSGFIDKTGRVVIEPVYDTAYSFSEGVAVAVKGDESYLIDKAGQKVLSQNNDQLRLDINNDARLSDGLIAAYDCAKAKVGFLDKAGRFVVEPKFVQAEPFSEGLARVAVEDEDGEEMLGFINRSGQFVIPPSFNTDAEFPRNSTDFSEGLASLTEGLNPTITEEAKFVYVDKKGTIVLQTEFFFAGPFHDGLAVVYDSESDRWGFIDKSGKVAIPLKYDSASDFSEGLAYVAVQGSE